MVNYTGIEAIGDGDRLPQRGTRLAVLCSALALLLWGCGGGGGGGGNVVQCADAVTSGYASGGGSDGPGARRRWRRSGCVVGRNGQCAVQRHAIGRLLRGSARTDSHGLVTIMNCGSNLPLLITVEGGSNATYWDEAKQATVPFPSGLVLHAMVASDGVAQTLSKNVGVTPLTEAAYQYAVANLPGGIKRVEGRGQRPEGESRGARRIQSLRALEQGDHRCDALAGFRAGCVNAGIHEFIAEPCLRGDPGGSVGGIEDCCDGFRNTGMDLTRQLAQDLADGRLDGIGPGQVPVAPPGTQAAYVPATLNADIVVGMQQAAQTNGKTQQVISYTLGGSITGADRKWVGTGPGRSDASGARERECVLVARFSWKALPIR